MSKHRFYQVDAFTSQVFGGNPAGVCPLDDWLPDTTLIKIAAENCLSETAYYVPRTTGFDLRWFTPTTEVNLCGHATLATAHVLYHREGFQGERIQFHTRSGMLEVARHKPAGYSMLFPADAAQPVPPHPAITRLKVRPKETLQSKHNYLVVLDSEEDVRQFEPDAKALADIDCATIVVTATGTLTDFVSRVFAPRLGVLEDPVTGSAHCTLTPYWSERLGKVELKAQQISTRGGELSCHYRGNHVLLIGQASLYLEGTIHVPGES